LKSTALKEDVKDIKEEDANVCPESTKKRVKLMQRSAMQLG
jgi:hypothetical protein